MFRYNISEHVHQRVPGGDSAQGDGCTGGIRGALEKQGVEKERATVYVAPSVSRMGRGYRAVPRLLCRSDR